MCAFSSSLLNTNACLFPKCTYQSEKFLIEPLNQIIAVLEASLHFLYFFSLSQSFFVLPTISYRLQVIGRSSGRKVTRNKVPNNQTNLFNFFSGSATSNNLVGCSFCFLFSACSLI